MHEENESELSVIVDHMDPYDLADAVHELADALGERRVTEIMKRIALDNIGLDPEHIGTRVDYAIGFDLDEWDSIADCGMDDQDMEDIATDMVVGGIENEFRDNVEMLIGLGMGEAACNLMRLVARGIRNCDCPLLDEYGKLRTGFPDHMEECANSGKPLEEFCWYS